MDKAMETALITLVNDYGEDYDIYLEDYQRVEFRIYNDNILKNILRSGKFVDIGNVFDYPDVLPQPEMINGFDLSQNFDLFQRIAISEKYNSIVFYTYDDYAIRCYFLIDTQYLKKFSKKTKSILQQDSRTDLFRDIDFKCKKGEYIEVTDATGSTTKPVDIKKKKVAKENLVFHEDSTIVEVMKDICTFFTEETKKLYEKMDIAYKRGVILYGDPGNGKSAMIREIIRSVPKISKIVINPNVHNVTRILASLINALNGKQAIVIIEDIDSLITERNRSDFLNILDGVDIKSGIFFIGTTNYPDQIDPAFMNRSGRFDRTYKIENPSEEVRRKYFKSRDVGELLGEYKVYKKDNKRDTGKGIVELFVQNSHDLPMASLKELITATKYALAANPEMSVEEAVEKSYNILTTVKTEHEAAHTNFRNRRINRWGAIEE